MGRQCFYQWAMGSRPRTFLVVAIPKNFSALLARPVLVNGYPALVFDFPAAPTKSKVPKYTLRDSRFCGRWGNRTSDLYNVNVTL